MAMEAMDTPLDSWAYLPQLPRYDVALDNLLLWPARNEHFNSGDTAIPSPTSSDHNQMLNHSNGVSFSNNHTPLPLSHQPHQPHSLYLMEQPPEKDESPTRFEIEVQESLSIDECSPSPLAPGAVHLPSVQVMDEQ